MRHTGYIDPLGRHISSGEVPTPIADKIVGSRADFIIMDEIGGTPMKFAPVAPFQVYQQFAVNCYIPSTILVLAHDIATNLGGYKETFEDPKWNDTNIILDNSVVETGKAADLEMVAKAYECVAADIVVLPDVMGSGVESFAATQKAYQAWKWRFRDGELMALIQGKDIVDWLHCAEMLKQYCPTPWIGIPRCAEGIKDPHTGKTYTRSDLVQFAHAIFPYYKIHLFGFSDSIWEDLRAATSKHVQSIDSNVPLRIAKTEKLLHEDPGKRTPWSEFEFHPRMIDNCRRVDYYISMLDPSNTNARIDDMLVTNIGIR